MQHNNNDAVDTSNYRQIISPTAAAQQQQQQQQQQNGHHTSSGYQNGGRRDSTQMWTPLLAPPTTTTTTTTANGSTSLLGNGSDTNGGVAIIGVGDMNGLLLDHDGDCGEADATTILYSHNNNDWKDSEELNNLKNGLLLHYNSQTQPTAAMAAMATAVPTQGGNNNNNGSLMNGRRNGHDKYDEQDPLTGNSSSNAPRYKPKKLKRSSEESDESDFDAESNGILKKSGDANGGDASGAGAGARGGDKNSPSSSGFSSASSGSMSSSGSSSSAAADTSGSSSCGLFGCHPKWARNFASTNVFMVVFLLAYILQGMYMTYFVSVITTIEKLFQIKSKTTGFLLSASEMGQISTALLLTYFAGRGHRPRWIACGMVLFSIAAFACSLPHFIFGKQLLQSSALLNAPPTSQILHSSLLDGGDNSSHLLVQGPHLNLCLLGNDSMSAMGSECNEDRKLEQASHSKITVIVLCIFFGSLLSSGIGQTAVATLGIPYIDDNVASKQSPMYMAITIGVRILGPASGFIVGSFCTRWYVNFSNPGYDATDPRWIGAWWLGPVVIGTLMMLSSIAMFSFPRQLRGKKPTPPTPTGTNAKLQEANGSTTADVVVEDKPRLKDFPKTVRRQLSNDILMFRTASCVFHLLPIAGLYTFLPKYLETQFRLATYDANMIAAFCGILVMGVGIVISGMVILKLKPSARSVAAWIAFTALVYSAGMVILMFVGCSMNDFAGYKEGTSNAPAVIEPACSAAMNCTCDRQNFAPICGIDGKIYISSCHAGCMAAEMRPSDNRTVYTQCSCIPDAPSTDLPAQPEAVSGYCDINCKNFVLFILIFAVCVFMHSTSEVGSMLLVMRCTHPKDKAMAMGVIQSAIGLFGNVPCPIIYGAVVDSACLIWKTVCGKHGACSLYDADTFRHYFLGITAGIMFLAFLMDLVVWSKAHRIDIAPEDGATDEANGKAAAAEAECNKAMASPDTRV